MEKVKTYPISPVFHPAAEGKKTHVGPTKFCALIKIFIPIFPHNQIREICPFLSYFLPLFFHFFLDHLNQIQCKLSILFPANDAMAQWQ